jgi:hypothetical protein
MRADFDPYEYDNYDWDDSRDRQRFERNHDEFGRPYRGVTMSSMRSNFSYNSGMSGNQDLRYCCELHGWQNYYDLHRLHQDHKTIAKAKAPEAEPKQFCHCAYTHYGMQGMHEFGDETYDCGKKALPEKYFRCCGQHGYVETGTYTRDDLHPWEKYKETDDIFFDTYPGGTKHVDNERGNWDSWRNEWIRTGNTYAFDRMKMYPPPPLPEKPKAVVAKVDDGITWGDAWPALAALGSAISVIVIAILSCLIMGGVI